MLTPELVSTFTSRLNQCELPYFITGSVAAIFYGEPRLTLGVDVVLELVLSQAPLLRAAFPDQDFYCPPLEVLEAEAGRARRGHFNVIHRATGFRADVYVAGRDPLHRWAMERRRSIALGGDGVWVAPPEYVIVRKLEYYREGGSEKHLGDIAGMLHLSRGAIDEPSLVELIKTRGLEEQWRAVAARADF